MTMKDENANGPEGNQNDWWRGLFGSAGWIAVQAGIPRERSAADAEIITRFLGLAPGGEILDVPCGEGRHAVELASRGFTVTGLDLSAELLDRARQRAESRNVQVDWVQGDMRRLEWKERFDAVVCYWGSFGYFDDQGDFEFLYGSSRALRPGGKMLIETQIAETLLPQFQPRGWIKLNDVYMLEERKYDHATGRAETRWTLIHDGRITEWHSSIRIYTYRELVEMLAEAGFTRFQGYDTSTGKPFALGASRLSMVATK